LIICDICSCDQRAVDLFSAISLMKDKDCICTRKNHKMDIVTDMPTGSTDGAQ
jgi:hypothetical protein